MYNKTIITFGFCDIQNNQDLGKGYQHQPSASADNPYLDLACVATILCSSGAKNYRAMNGVSKRGGRERGRKEGRKRLQTNPWILKTAYTQTEMSSCHK